MPYICNEFISIVTYKLDNPWCDSTVSNRIDTWNLWNAALVCSSNFAPMQSHTHKANVCDLLHPVNLLMTIL
jgi:hypothetical protein